MRNMIATLLFSQGTPMILAGDEFARTQGGNNNAYAQDNEIGWIDWEGIDDEGRALLDFTRTVVELRRENSILRRGRFLSGAYNAELDVKDVTWLTPLGEEMSEANWKDPMARSLGVLLDGRAQPTGIRRRGTDLTLLLIVNAHDEAVVFKLPTVVGGRDWRRLLDTNQPEPGRPKPFQFGHDYVVTGRSLLLFKLWRDRSRNQAPASTSP
jgi:glycogen operon protein